MIHLVIRHFRFSNSVLRYGNQTEPWRNFRRSRVIRRAPRLLSTILAKSWVFPEPAESQWAGSAPHTRCYGNAGFQQTSVPLAGTLGTHRLPSTTTVRSLASRCELAKTERATFRHS